MKSANRSQISIRHTLSPTLRRLEKKRVVIYVRVSRESETKHQSIENQKEHLRTFINQRPNWMFAGFYIDEGVTGTTMNRPEFNRMMDDARAGRIDVILTKSVSRFGRNIAAVQKVLQELIELDVTVIFDNEQISTNNTEALFALQFNGIQAEAQAKQISDYQKWAIRSRYKEGLVNSARPFGYIAVNHQLQIIPEEAEIVKRIFSMYLSGMGKLAISKALNDDGSTTKNKILWQPSTIHAVLHNEVYVGDLLLQKTYINNYIDKKKVKNCGELPQYLVTNAHEPIIDRATYEKVQAEIAKRKEDYVFSDTTHIKKKRLFTELIRCGYCGKRVYYKNFHGGCKRITWVCKTHLELGPDHCPIKAIREDILEDTTRKVLLSKSLINKDTPLTNDILRAHIRQIISKDNQELEYHLRNGEIISETWSYPSRSKSWTPEMKQEAREKTLLRNMAKKEMIVNE